MAEPLIGPGEVWLVGAGPGDPDLLTRKAERLVREASVIFFDALVDERVLALAPAHVRLVSVGKRSGRHPRSQEEINALLVRAARAGERVVRLKGGDPSIFGRSAEEIAPLRDHGLPVRVCPGVTTASAAAASGALSLTRRGIARTLSFVTAHACAGEPLDLDWQALADGGTTLAIHMGRAAAGEVAANLIAAGRSPDTPVLVAVNVARVQERLVLGRLATLALLVETVAHHEPTLLLVGEALQRDSGSTRFAG